MSEREFFVRGEFGILSLVKYLEHEISEGKTLAVVVRGWEEKMSPADRRRYYALRTLASAHCEMQGKKWPRAAWHLFFKMQFLEPLDDGSTRSIGDLKRAEGKAFVQHVETFLAEHGVYLPLREEISPHG